jgi:hypothetical protein
MDAALIAAGSLALLAAAVHGGAGELFVVRKLTLATLPGTRFGGPRMTRAMIHVTWHIVTIAFLSVGCALLVAALVSNGDTARGIGLVAAGAATGYALVALGLGVANTRTPRALLQHPGPIALSAIAALAWWGAL